MKAQKNRTLKVKCLILDHDDTVVKSTPEINFPAFLPVIEGTAERHDNELRTVRGIQLQSRFL